MIPPEISEQPIAWEYRGWRFGGWLRGGKNYQIYTRRSLLHSMDLIGMQGKCSTLVHCLRMTQ